MKHMLGLVFQLARVKEETTIEKIFERKGNLTKYIG
jgi:hypothetical protein